MPSHRKLIKHYLGIHFSFLAILSPFFATPHTHVHPENRLPVLIRRIPQRLQNLQIRQTLEIIGKYAWFKSERF